MTDSGTKTDQGEQPSSNETFLAFVSDGALLLFVVFFGLIALAIKSSGADGGDTDAPGGSGSGTIEVTLDEFVIDGNFIAPAGEVILDVVNVGTVNHNVVARGLGRRTPDVRAGGEVTLSLGSLTAGSYVLFCDLPGHEESGMVTTLTVEDA